MTGRPTVACAVALGLFCLLSTGCGESPSTVEGRVTYQGKPLTSGSVIVYCSDKQIARSLIGTDGTYSIPNVPPGRAIVTVQAHSRVPAGMRLQQTLPSAHNGPAAPVIDAADRSRVVIPLRYAMPDESGLTVVVDQGRVTYDIDLKP